MKKLTILLLCVLLLAGCAQVYDGPTEGRYVLGEEFSEYYDDEGNVMYTTRTSYSYDVNGNPAVIILSRNGEEQEKILATYDEKGNLLKQKNYDLTGFFPWPTWSMEQKFDEQGRILEVTDRRGWEKNTVTHTYGAEKYTVTYSAGYTETGYLDENGFVYRREYSGNPGEVTEYTRDGVGNVLTAHTYQDGTLVKTQAYTYDAQGRRLSWTETVDGVTKTLMRWEYGEHMQTCYYDNGHYIVYYYDENRPGDVTTRVHYDESGTKRSCEFCSYRQIQVPARKEEP